MKLLAFTDVFYKFMLTDRCDAGNDCSVNATCTNDTTANNGYPWKLLAFTDVFYKFMLTDRCDAGNDCSVNATCTNDATANNGYP